MNFGTPRANFKKLKIKKISATRTQLVEVFEPWRITLPIFEKSVVPTIPKFKKKKIHKDFKNQEMVY